MKLRGCNSRGKSFTCKENKFIVALEFIQEKTFIVKKYILISHNFLTESKHSKKFPHLALWSLGCLPTGRPFQLCDRYREECPGIRPPAGLGAHALPTKQKHGDKGKQHAKIQIKYYHLCCLLGNEKYLSPNRTEILRKYTIFFKICITG